MKSIQQIWLLAAYLLISTISYAQVGIGTTTPQGALDVVSTDSGLLLPRVVDTTAVTTPVNGMLIYSNTDNCLKIYRSSSWSNCLTTGDQFTNTTTLLIQIGNEADDPDTVNSVITAAEINSIVGVTGAILANETAYQDYIDNYPNAISSPATEFEVQTMVDDVNAGLWTPASITTEAWYDATDAATITESFNVVSQWNDKSGNNRHVIQADPSHRPLTNTRTINGLNGIEGSDNESLSLTLATSITSANYLMVSIYQPDEINSKSGYVRLDGNTTTPETFEIVQETELDNNEFYFFSNTTDPEKDIVSAATIGTNYLASSTVKADGSMAYYLQGSSVGTDTVAPEVINDVGSITLLAINHLPNATPRAIDGILGEVVIATDTSDATRQLLEGYFAWKWGLEGNLPASHPYKDVPPFN